MPALLAAAVMLALSCSEYPRNKTFSKVPVSHIRKGEKLAARYCQSCHLLPDPSLADAQTWEEGILPQMAPRLGIFRYLYHRYPNSRNDPSVGKDYYPAERLVNDQEWQYIIDYYTATSPDSLPGQEREIGIDKSGLPLFEERMPALKSAPSSLSWVAIDTQLFKNQLLVFDLSSRQLLRYNSNLQALDSQQVQGCIVNGVVQDNHWLSCNIGHINPTNSRQGLAQVFLRPEGPGSRDSVVLLSELARPVEVLPADLNQDGAVDLLVCEFGFMTGSLSWYEQLTVKDSGSAAAYRRHVLRAQPGAIKTYLEDVNGDGLTDIWALFAQGDEGIFLYTNQGNGKFREERLLQFPPSYGSTFFELADINGDGNRDILYTCGDNADYSIIMKPYHGIYVFLNDGRNRFTQKWFYPVNGCYKALARDFDRDGDLDIASISFFADYARQPEEGFVYLENRGGMQFSPFSFPGAVKGRWLTMDAGDLDGDGWTDLVLGNFSEGPPFMNAAFDWRKGPSFIFLKNRGQ